MIASVSEERQKKEDILETKRPLTQRWTEVSSYHLTGHVTNVLQSKMAIKMLQLLVFAVLFFLAASSDIFDRILSDVSPCAEVCRNTYSPHTNDIKVYDHYIFVIFFLFLFIFNWSNLHAFSIKRCSWHFQT